MSMNTLNLNAELFRELSYIADDESSMKKVLKYVKKLAAKQYKTPAPTVSVASEDTEPYRPKTKAELIEDLNEVCKEIKLIRAGKLKGRPAEELLNEL